MINIDTGGPHTERRWRKKKCIQKNCTMQKSSGTNTMPTGIERKKNFFFLVLRSEFNWLFSWTHEYHIFTSWHGQKGNPIDIAYQYHCYVQCTLFIVWCTLHCISNTGFSRISDIIRNCIRSVAQTKCIRE